jgi:hypothetical protein
VIFGTFSWRTSENTCSTTLMNKGKKKGRRVEIHREFIAAF